MTDANKATPERIGRVTPARWKICKYIWTLLARAFDRCWSRRLTGPFWSVYDYSCAVSVSSPRRAIKIPSSIIILATQYDAISENDTNWTGVYLCLANSNGPHRDAFANRSQFNGIRNARYLAIKAQRGRCSSGAHEYWIIICNAHQLLWTLNEFAVRVCVVALSRNDDIKITGTANERTCYVRN